jgi:type I restriction enzyme R subunit
MTEFKQIIGRGTRVRDDYGKYFFNILDYTGSATTLFADPDFDGDPVRTTYEEIDNEGQSQRPPEIEQPTKSPEDDEFIAIDVNGKKEKLRERYKYYYDGGEVDIATEGIYALDSDGKRLHLVQLTDYTAEKVRTLYPNAAALRAEWADPQRRAEIFKVAPFPKYGNTREIMSLFGGAEKLREAVQHLQALLYAA